MDSDHVTYPERLLIHECSIKRETPTGDQSPWGHEVTDVTWDTVRCRFGNSSGGLFSDHEHSVDSVYCIVQTTTNIKPTDVIASTSTGFVGDYIVTDVKIAALADRVSHIVLKLKIADRVT